jgi:hypothetical protein
MIANVSGMTFRDRVVYGFVFAPSLNLVPRSLSRTRQRLQLGRFGKVHRWKSRSAEQRIRQRSIFRSQSSYFPFQQADIAGAQ